ncbi:MBL fold metallo-hydrolase [Bordetella trematum]|uniref:MBL fold metallo-hydrolase n=1 Tax=Bordetella trematum TaxID=123899 RepID=UPI003988E725
MKRGFSACLLALGMGWTATLAAQPAQCPAQGVALQLLGSGGPISDDARASSGALLWIDGKARALIDAGGGTYLRYGQSGARLEDLDFIGISHFHTDHVSDLPALLKGAYFLSGEHALTLAGPSGNADFPSMKAFYDALFARPKGAFRYLAGLSDGSEGLGLNVRVTDVDVAAMQGQPVFEGKDFQVYALGIPHGDVPTLAFRIVTPQAVAVVSADQNGSRPAFVDFARGADLLVMPAAITEDADDTSRFLHAKPSVVGDIAASVQPSKLVLNHFMGRALYDKEETLAEVTRRFPGTTVAGRDLACFILSQP